MLCILSPLGFYAIFLENRQLFDVMPVTHSSKGRQVHQKMACCGGVGSTTPGIS